MPSATLTTAAAGRVDRVLVAEPRGFCAGVEMATSTRSTRPEAAVFKVADGMSGP